MLNSSEGEIELQNDPERHSYLSNIDEVLEENDYYTIKSIIDTYYTNVNNSLTYTSETNQADKQLILGSLLNIIDQEALTYLGINEGNIVEFIQEYKNDVYVIEKMYRVEKTVNTNMYYIKLSLDYKKEVGLIVKTDSYNETFSIYPEKYVEDKNLDENSLKTEFKIDDIEYIQKNYANTYTVQNVTDSMVVQYYLTDYGRTVIADKQKAYELLDNQYKQNRFSTFNEYSKYINEDIKNYKDLQVVKYYVSKDENDDTTIYSCTDQYGNVYIFKENSIMDYSLQLDDYTLNNSIINEEYETYEQVDKGMTNIRKFFEMIGMQDYEKAYSVLDDSFKQTYFPTVQEFTQYIQNRLFRYNKITSGFYENNITNVYVYRLKITDATVQGGEEKDFNIIMKLLEGTDFVMSFEVN